MRDSFRVIHTDVEKVVIKFDPSLERYLKENIWHPSQVFRKEKDGGVVLTMEVSGLVEVMSWVLGFGRQAEVLEPVHLRQAVAEEIATTMGKYGREPLQPLQEGAEKIPWSERQAISARTCPKSLLPSPKSLLPTVNSVVR